MEFPPLLLLERLLFSPDELFSPLEEPPGIDPPGNENPPDDISGLPLVLPEKLGIEPPEKFGIPLLDCDCS